MNAIIEYADNFAIHVILMRSVWSEEWKIMSSFWWFFFHFLITVDEIWLYTMLCIYILKVASWFTLMFSGAGEYNLNLDYYMGNDESIFHLRWDRIEGIYHWRLFTIYKTLENNLFLFFFHLKKKTRLKKNYLKAIKSKSIHNTCIHTYNIFDHKIFWLIFNNISCASVCNVRQCVEEKENMCSIILIICSSPFTSYTRTSHTHMHTEQIHISIYRKAFGNEWINVKEPYHWLFMEVQCNCCQNSRKEKLQHHRKYPSLVIWCATPEKSNPRALSLRLELLNIRSSSYFTNRADLVCQYFGCREGESVEY